MRCSALLNLRARSTNLPSSTALACFLTHALLQIYKLLIFKRIESTVDRLKLLSYLKIWLKTLETLYLIPIAQSFRFILLLPQQTLRREKKNRNTSSYLILTFHQPEKKVRVVHLDKDLGTWLKIFSTRDICLRLQNGNFQASKFTYNPVKWGVS